MYFCNGRGADGRFWSVGGEWPDCIISVHGEEREKERRTIKHLVIDEAMLERRDYVRFPERMLGMESVTVLLMPWASRPGSGGVLVERFDLEDEMVEREEWEEEKGWGLKRLRNEFLEWMEEVRVKLRLERKAVVKVSQWGACLDSGDEGPWRLVETGLWVHWEYDGGIGRAS